MNYLIKTICLAVLLISTIVYAGEDSQNETETVFQRNPYRSYYTDHFWLTANEGLMWTPVSNLQTTSGIGTGTEFQIRFQLDRWGILAEYHNQNYQIWDPANMHNEVYGLGATFRIFSPGEHNRFFSGSHLLAHLEAVYGHSDYLVTDLNSSANNTAGTSTSWGGKGGVDFFIPIYFGFWGYAGGELEYNEFQYKVSPSNFRMHPSSGSNLNFLPHVGIAFSI